MERKISWPLYLTAFVISAIIFIAGIYVGTLLDSAEINALSSNVDSLSKEISTVQVLMLSEEGSAFCPVYAEEFQKIDGEREKVGYELTYLEEERNVYSPELKKDYFVLEAQSYFLAKKLQEVCDDDTVLVLYFYSNENCEDCSKQGIDILSARDASSENVLIYSFDGDLGSTMAEGFMTQYNVTTYPSVVINGETHSGYMSQEELAAEFSK